MTHDPRRVTELLLDATHRNQLTSLVGRLIRQLVWDLNAIYFVGDVNTLKLAAEMRRPPSPTPSEFAEASCLTVEWVDDAGPFYPNHDDEYWYRVVAEHVRIEGFEIVRTGILMPTEQAWPLGEAPPADGWVTSCDCGVLITTSAGILPAVQRQNAYGFMNWPVVGLYQRAHVLQLLDAHGSLFQLHPLEAPTHSDRVI